MQKLVKSFGNKFIQIKHMKKAFLVTVSCMLLPTLLFAQLGINTVAPHSSSMLDVSSSTKGLLIPRMSTAQRNAVANPAAGLLVFDLDKSTIFFFDGQKWQPMLFSTSVAGIPPIGRSASDGEASDHFGNSVSISGDYAIAGAPYDDIATKTDQGSAYIFAKVNGNWVEQAKLIAPDGLANDHFGNSVSISGDYAIVGAPNGTGDWFLQGAAYIFVRSGTSWSLQAKLNASDGIIGDYFGTSVCINGDYVVVGTPSDDGQFAGEGSAYVFVRNGVNWSQQSKLVATLPGPDINLGYSVGISGEYVIAGALYYSASTSNQGAAYVFKRSGTAWAQQAVLTHSDYDSDDNFGYSVSISGDYAVVGALYVDDASLNNNGSVYIFLRSGTSWSQQAKIIAPDPETDTFFGHSVSISGDHIIAGAVYDNVGINAIQGSAYVFKRTGTAWNPVRKVDDGNGQAQGRFGWAVAMSGFNCITGAVGKNGGKGEVNFLNIE
jgi:hypothetical protein